MKKRYNNDAMRLVSLCVNSVRVCVVCVCCVRVLCVCLCMCVCVWGEGSLWDIIIS